MLLQSVWVLYLPISVSVSGHGVVGPLLPSIHTGGASQVSATAFFSKILPAGRAPEGETGKDAPQIPCLQSVRNTDGKSVA